MPTIFFHFLGFLFSFLTQNHEEYIQYTYNTYNIHIHTPVQKPAHNDHLKHMCKKLYI